MQPAWATAAVPHTLGLQLAAAEQVELLHLRVSAAFQAQAAQQLALRSIQYALMQVYGRSFVRAQSDTHAQTQAKQRIAVPEFQISVQLHGLCQLLPSSMQTRERASQHSSTAHARLCMLIT